MTSWKSYLKSDPTDWLLSQENPSVRYFTLVDILGKDENDPLVVQAKQAIMHSGVVPEILNKQHEDGYWDKPGSFYTAKYRGTVWQLLILAELGVDGNDQRIKRSCEFILGRSQDPQSHGFSINGSAKNKGGTHGYVIPCLTGNLTWCLIRHGFAVDERVQKAVDWINTYQRFDDMVEESPTGWPYDGFEMCWGRHTCHMGVVKVLKALAEIPKENRSQETQKTIEDAVDFLLKHQIYKKSHDPGKVSRPGWLRLGFPLMYQTDILEILGILAKLGIRDNRMQEAVDRIVSSQDEQGRWKMQNSFNDRILVEIEEKGQPSRWITLNALRVLKHYYS